MTKTKTNVNEARTAERAERARVAAEEQQALWEARNWAKLTDAEERELAARIEDALLDAVEGHECDRAMRAAQTMNDAAKMKGTRRGEWMASAERILDDDALAG